MKFSSVVLALLLSIGNMANAAWQVSEAESKVYFSSTKNETVFETHSISNVSGKWEKNGKLTVLMPISKVETGIEIRNQRLKDIVFKQNEYPSAIFTANVTPKKVKELKVGDSIEMETVGELTLAGKKQSLPIRFSVLRKSKSELDIKNIGNINVDAGNLGLGESIEKLKEIAKLNAISLNVPVTFEIKLVDMH